jgi:hypothetical protein
MSCATERAVGDSSLRYVGRSWRYLRRLRRLVGNYLLDPVKSPAGVDEILHDQHVTVSGVWGLAGRRVRQYVAGACCEVCEGAIKQRGVCVRTWIVCVCVWVGGGVGVGGERRNRVSNQLHCHSFIQRCSAPMLRSFLTLTEPLLFVLLP